MPPTKNLNAYAYHERVLETALAHGGAKLSLPTESEAFVWRRDANYFRTLLRQRSTDGRCKYDVIKISLKGKIVILENRTDPEITGLTGLDGKRLEAVKVEKKPEVTLSPIERLALIEKELDLDD